MRTQLILGALAVVAVGQAATFSDEGAWRTAVGIWTMDDFESYSTPSDMDVNTMLGLDFQQLSAKAAQPTVQSRFNTGGTAVSETNVLLNDNDYALPGGGDIIADSMGNLRGFGVWNTGGDDTVEIRAYDSANQLMDSITSLSGQSFVGIATTSDIARIEISGIGGNGYFTLDNMQTSVVPEPFTMAGMAGFALLALRRRAKK